MPHVALLPESVIKQIAAGEVLENPAAAVKELVENAIDAGATEILVEIEGGGLERLLVEDDGCGMGREDALLSLERHATSKIRNADDLQRLQTMGFRGEALASLVAVSNLELKTFNGEESTRIAAASGEIQAIAPCARNRGTSVEARDLFASAPARLKFQKTPSACAAAVLKGVRTLSLAHPEIRFRLRSNKQVTFEVEPAPWQERARGVFGPFAHEISRNGCRGLFGSPNDARTNRSYQTLFVNRRPVFAPLIAKAVKDGFGTRMQASLFPQFVLFLEVPPEQIDVNVHPQKKEVRFRDERQIYSLVRGATEQALSAQSEMAFPPIHFEPPPPFTPLFFDTALPSPQFQQQLLPDLNIATPKMVIGRYLLVQGDSWRLLDLQGAEARILFEAIHRQTPDMQQLFLPLEIAMGPDESPEELADQLKAAHIEARAVGKRTLAIDALPAGLSPADAIPFIREYIGGAQSERRLAAALTRSCRGSSRSYSLEQAAAIWHALCRASDREYDPLGKKIAAEITEEQMKEFFH